eukprot:TRINITY_DN56488_c0_g1_i1.p1 TRINITY_DN56488_c0_g1~~TRINITY_DN56488_c0_g1_i1.p1  ORF type:complete len:902 (+),score=145.78 TRINITY_DN56488_c0_g1_i1:46-2706(+)
MAMGPPPPQLLRRPLPVGRAPSRRAQTTPAALPTGYSGITDSSSPASSSSARPPRPPEKHQAPSAPESRQRPSSQILVRRDSVKGLGSQSRSCSLPPLGARDAVTASQERVPGVGRGRGFTGGHNSCTEGGSGGSGVTVRCGGGGPATAARTVSAAASSCEPKRSSAASATSVGSGRVPASDGAKDNGGSAPVQTLASAGTSSKKISSASAAAGGAAAMDALALRRLGLEAALQEWKKRRSLDAEALVFSISGAFPGIKKALTARGWVENTDLSSPLWNLKYSLLQKDLGEPGELDERQVVNFFGRNSEITAKYGLCNNLYGWTTSEGVDVNTFMPRVYDLTSPSQVECFIQDFKATSCQCMLRRFVADGGRTAEGGATAAFPRAAVAAAISACSRRVRSVDDALDEPLLELVTDEEWKALELCSLKHPGRKLKPWKGATVASAVAAAAAGISPKSAASTSAARTSASYAVAEEVEVTEEADEHAPSEASDGDEAEGEGVSPGQAGRTVVGACSRTEEDEVLFVAARGLLEPLRRLLPQFGIDGNQNIWVLKPAGKSRGRGIQLTARLEKVLDVGVGRGMEGRWIAQKYMENPQIIERKKFDIRQWVVVTRWDPLSVWFYDDCYLRFSFADYDPTKLKNRYAHLTNNSISKHAKDFEDHQDETMIDSDEYREHLRTLRFEKDGKVIEDPWTEIVHPKLKKMVMYSLASVQDVVQPRSSSFQLFGYDFMVSDDLEAWLIEVNSSPDLSYSTSTTRVLVKAMLEDLVRVVVDVEKFGHQVERPRKKWDRCRANTGRFVLLEPERRRREERFGRSRKAKAAGQLEIRGVGIKPRRPRKGEWPLTATDTRVLDAVELLAAGGGIGTVDEFEGVDMASAASGEEGSEASTD